MAEIYQFKCKDCNYIIHINELVEPNRLQEIFRSIR